MIIVIITNNDFLLFLSFATYVTLWYVKIYKMKMQIFIHFINGTVITVIIKLNINNFHVNELHEVIHRYEQKADRKG